MPLRVPSDHPIRPSNRHSTTCHPPIIAFLLAIRLFFAAAQSRLAGFPTIASHRITSPFLHL